MRSKEVENSIKELTEITELVKEEIKNNDENTTAILDITDLKNLDTVLNYISEYIPKQVIRDKIKELEHEKFKRTQLGVFMLKNYENQRLLAQIEVLKELLEGEE